jgi:hypothetical protein
MSEPRPKMTPHPWPDMTEPTTEELLPWFLEQSTEAQLWLLERSSCGTRTQGGEVTVEAALELMAEAEQEARELSRWPHNESARPARWARDRLRLIERDRATLQRHRDAGIAGQWHMGCAACGREWPCPDAAAVIRFWGEAP